MALTGAGAKKTKINQPVQGGTAPLQGIVPAKALKSLTKMQTVRRYRRFAPSMAFSFMRARITVPLYHLLDL
jgi:hypothetical protein